MKDKPFVVASVRELIIEMNSGKISFGRMVEKINEIAIKWHNTQRNG